MNSRFDEDKPLQTEPNKNPKKCPNSKQSKPALEEDEFWKDCIENSETKTSINENKEPKNKNSENDEIYLTCIHIIYLVNDVKSERKKIPKPKNNENNEQNIHTSSSSSRKIKPNVEEKFRKLETKLQETERTTTNTSLNMGKKKNSSIERCYLLYEKGKIKNEVNKLIIQKNFELKEKQMLSKCTFKPRTNSVKFLKTNIKESQRGTLYERTEFWKKNKLDKYHILIIESKRKRIIL